MNLLESLGEPADCVVTLDFETYYAKDYTLKKMTTEAYVRDPRFEVIGVGVAVGDRPAVWLSEADFRAWAKMVDWSRCAILAHNYAFDGFILSHHYDLVPAFCLDTLSMGRPLHGIEVGGSLAKLALHYGVGEKGDEVLNALGKRRADFTPEEWFRYGEYCRNDVELARVIFHKMLAAGFLPTELWVIDTTLRMAVQPRFRLDTPLLTEFLEYEKERKLDLLARVNADRSVLMSNPKFALLLAELGVDPPKKISPRTGKETFAFAKSDPGMKALLEHDVEEVRWVAEARVGVKSTINETRTERFLKMGAEGRPVPVFLKYHGAHTGRWAGSERVNFQNLERCDKRNPRKGVLRKALLAPEGEGVVASDSSQIEARVLAWEAGHTELIEAFAQGRDVYSEFASEAYGRPVNRKRTLPDGTKPDEEAGNVGKVCILGLGYGLSWAKLSQIMLAGPMGSPPVQFKWEDDIARRADVERFADDPGLMKRMQAIPTRLPEQDMLVHAAVSKYLVDKWRRKNEAIVAFWGEMDPVLAAMAAGTEYVFGPNGCFRTEKERLVLPSGRTLKYPGLEESDDGYSYRGRRGKERMRIYGGSLVENITQAVARDIIAEQMLWIRVDGYPIGTTTHDEVVGFAPEADGASAKAKMFARMKVPPPWAQGVPLAAEAGFARSYGLAK